MAKRLKGRVAIVTGSSLGIGKAIAILMADEGAKVVTNSRGPEAENTAKEIVAKGGEAVAFIGDVSKFKVAKGLVQTAIDKYGKLDILVNNAGVLGPHWFWDITPKIFDQVIKTSIYGTYNCCQAACKLMMAQKSGRIINASSVNSFNALETSHYAAAKAGVLGLTTALARELGPYGITVNAYMPFANTRLTLDEAAKIRFKNRYEGGIYTKERYEYMLNPPGPESVAPVVVYLATDEAADINGQAFRISGKKLGWFTCDTETNLTEKSGGWWTVDELIKVVPTQILKGYKNPAPRTK